VKFDLAAAVKAQRRIRRREIALRTIAATQAQADELARILVRAPAVWQARASQIEAAYAASLPRALISDSVSDIERLIADVGGEIERLILTIDPLLSEWAVRQERYVRNRWRDGVLAATGIDLETVLGPEEAREPVQAWLARNTALVRSVSDDTKARISDIVFRGITARTPARDVGREISDATGMGRRRAQRIASDQATKLTATLADERRRQAGIRHWKWRHSGKLHPREEHVRRDGKEYTDETAPNDKPGQLPFCGCRSQAVLKLD
jgi:hypothetical protein